MLTGPRTADLQAATALDGIVLHASGKDPRWKEAIRLQRLGLLRVRPDNRTTATLLFVRPPDPAPEPVAEVKPPPIMEQDGFRVTPPCLMPDGTWHASAIRAAPSAAGGTASGRTAEEARAGAVSIMAEVLAGDQATAERRAA